MTEEELIEIFQNGDREKIDAILTRVNTDPAFVRAVDKRFDDRQGGEYADLRDDPKIWDVCKQWDKEIAQKHPDASYDARLDVVAQVGRKVFGTPESRAIREMKLQRNPNLKPEDLDYVPEETRSEFDQEHDAGISEAIEQMRRGRAGTPLSEIRRRRAGTTPAETNET